MKLTGKIATLAIFFGIVTAPYAYEISWQPQAILAFRMTDDFSFGMAGSMHSGPHLDQTETLLTPGELNNVLIPFNEKGYNGWTAKPWLEIKLAKVGSIDITGGGEVAVISRQKVKDQPVVVVKNGGERDSLDGSDFFEVRPAGIFSIGLPVNSLINFKFTNRLERRLFRSPVVQGNAISYFRYVSDVTLSAVPLTAQKIVPYVSYTGFSQQDSRLLSVAGAGIVLSPLDGLSFDIVYQLRWYPSGRNLSEHQVGIDAKYIFDFSK